MATSSIEWTDATWQVTRGCSQVSAGCTNCYAQSFAHRGLHAATRGLTRATANGPRWTGEIRLAPDNLSQPLKWKRGRRIFVNSMSDLFHEDVPDEYIDQVFGVMAACRYIGRDAMPGHTFQVLTKRAERMSAYLSIDRRNAWARAAVQHGGGIEPDGIHDQTVFGPPVLPNVWLGVSVENQEQADERIPHLLCVPAAVRFLSCEPLLGRVDLEPFLHLPHMFRWADVPAGAAGRIDWVIVGGESGHGARECRESWLRSIVDQCQSADVPVFVKQMGAAAIDDVTWRGSEPSYQFHDKKGGDPAEWPEALRVREFPAVSK